MTKIITHSAPKTKKMPLIAIDVAKLERSLPTKTPRSHHIVIKVEQLHKSFKVGKNTINILKNIKLNFYAGEFAIISGPSGSGKSTLLHTILGLEPPSSGKVIVRDIDLYKSLDDQGRTRFRRDKVGVVFQQSNWIKSLNVIENVAYPLWLAGKKPSEAEQLSAEWLKKVGMFEWAKHHPSELSGGQHQKVALARAMVNDPGIIVADEPTGNLDTEASEEMMSLLAKLNRLENKLILMVTHNLSLLPIATRRVVIKDGQIIYDQHD